jgi:hypothetical protein
MYMYMVCFMCVLNLISIYIFIMHKRLKYWFLEPVNPGSNCKSCEVDGVCRAFGDKFQKDCFTYECRPYGNSWRAEVVKAGIAFFTLILLLVLQKAWFLLLIYPHFIRCTNLCCRCMHLTRPCCIFATKDFLKNYLDFQQSFDYKCTWWRVFQKRFVRSKVDI